MRLRPGVKPYWPDRPDPWHPTFVREKSTAKVGFVTRATPSNGNSVPAQAFVQFWAQVGGQPVLMEEQWIPARELERVL